MRIVSLIDDHGLRLASCRYVGHMIGKLNRFAHGSKFVDPGVDQLSFRDSREHACGQFSGHDGL
jgi:hypothetical protein